MYVSARSDYALRAMLAVAVAAADGGGTTGDLGHAPAPGGELVKAAALAESQAIPLSFLQGILLDLRRAGLLLSHRGAEGGYALTRPADEISVGDVLRAVGGSLTSVRGLPAEIAGYHGVATGLRDVWLAVDGAIATVVDRTSLADLLAAKSREPAARDGARATARP
ncbi:BadM/Rrf2 family transcriptional regulator [Micromonospora sp. ATCC 39149]|uniref:Rrf2 family transcriptional regulator n=1 Tax=Micromonospora carbonacea TaxID=47853 RepID=A0A7D6C6M1_9ACTN|nr:Rrf2 family transcriptional regulator [Micromonospora sp. ATCC 39149]EEP71571.1 BadM/Rrf2 family transcriptional regulator [Micromonospora sp. ATCC 39149]QLJ97827.1 Rrf2 family transcriptional regulator [Micromonospora carbonacea]